MTLDTVTLREVIAEASTRIAHRDAELLLQHTLERDRAWLLAHMDDRIDAAALSSFSALAARRAAREPLQYITGHQEFYGLDLRVTPAVLIPRPETEHLVEAVLLWATRFHDEHTLHIADVGTGSGAIVLALATHLAGARFVATDISEAALAVARENAHLHGCEARVEFLHGDLLPPEALAEGLLFDAIVSNPPYIPLADAPTLQHEVVGHEPHSALFAGDDGLSLYRRLIPAAQAALRPGGLLALEIGFGQSAALAVLLDGWHNVRFVDDLQGIPRVALAERP